MGILWKNGGTPPMENGRDQVFLPVQAKLLCMGWSWIAFAQILLPSLCMPWLLCAQAACSLPSADILFCLIIAQYRWFCKAF